MKLSEDNEYVLEGLVWVLNEKYRDAGPDMPSEHDLEEEVADMVLAECGGADYNTAVDFVMESFEWR